MAFQADVLVANKVIYKSNDILSGTREVSQMVSDNLVIIDSDSLTGTNDTNTITNISDEILSGTLYIDVTLDINASSADYTNVIKVNGFNPSFIESNDNTIKFISNNTNINAFEIISTGAYTITEVNVSRNYNNIKLTSDYVSLPYTYNKVKQENWKIIRSSAKIDYDNSFTELLNVSLNENLLTNDVTLLKGDVISIDKETFTYVSYINSLGEAVLDNISNIHDGVTESEFTKQDVYKINFLKDYRDDTYEYGLKSALLNQEVSGNIIYGAMGDEIIVEANEGGQIVLGEMYTTGNYGSIDATDPFEIHVSDDGTNWNKVYENIALLQTPKTHFMSGSGRYVKIVFTNETNGWGRIQTNSVNGKFWNLSIVHPESKLYKFLPSLSVNGTKVIPDYVDYFNDYSIKTVKYPMTIIDDFEITIDSNLITNIENELWYEIVGVV